MKVKKLISVLLATGMIATVAAGCGGDGGSGSAGESRTLRVGNTWGASHPTSVALEETFKPMIEEGTNGAIQIEIYNDGLLGDELGLWQGVRDGSIDFAPVGSGMNQEFPMMSFPTGPSCIGMWSMPKTYGPARWPTR